MAGLIRVFGQIELAEDAVQDAFAVALRTWPLRDQDRSSWDRALIAEGHRPGPTGRICRGYYAAHAVRADLLHRLGRPDQAAQACTAAAAPAPSRAEQDHLSARALALRRRPPEPC